LISLNTLLPQTKKTVILSLPLVLSHSISTFNGIADKVFASFLPAGRISALRYSQFLLSMINSLIVSSLLTTVYTEIGEFAAKKDYLSIELRAKKTNNDLMNIVIPLTFWIMLMAEPIIGIIFQRGAFDCSSTELVSASLIAYSVIILLSPISNIITNIYISL
jgi:putative peptidoglycan lipid II flippase